MPYVIYAYSSASNYYTLTGYSAPPSVDGSSGSGVLPNGYEKITRQFVEWNCNSDSVYAYPASEVMEFGVFSVDKPSKVITSWDIDIIGTLSDNVTLYFGGGSGGDEPPSGDPWVGTDTVCRIIMPRDGFKQQGVKLSTTVVYFCIPYDGNKNNIQYAMPGDIDHDKSKATKLDLNVIENGFSVCLVLTSRRLLPLVSSFRGFLLCSWASFLSRAFFNCSVG